MNRKFSVAGVAAIAAVLGAATPGHGRPALSWSPRASRIPSEYVAPMPAFGIRFAPQNVAAGVHPTLPGGQTGITIDQAITAATSYTVGARDGRLLPGVQVSAQFGMFSDDELAQRLSSGEMQPLFQNRPAWIVTFFGPGLLKYPHGYPALRAPGTANPGAAAAPDTRVHHEENIVVDAATAQYMESYS